MKCQRKKYVSLPIVWLPETVRPNEIKSFTKYSNTKTNAGLLSLHHIPRSPATSPKRARGKKQTLNTATVFCDFKNKNKSKTTVWKAEGKKHRVMSLQWWQMGQIFVQEFSGRDAYFLQLSTPTACCFILNVQEIIRLGIQDYFTPKKRRKQLIYDN